MAVSLKNRAQDGDPRDATATPRYVRPGPESPGTASRRGPSDTITRRPGEMVDPGPQTKRETPGTAGRPRGHSDQVPSCAGQLFKHACHRTRARFARDSWSTPWDIGHRRLSPWTAGRTRGPSDPSARRPRKVFDTARRRHSAESPRRDDQHRRPSCHLPAGCGWGFGACALRAFSCTISLPTEGEQGWSWVPTRDQQPSSSAHVASGSPGHPWPFGEPRPR